MSRSKSCRESMSLAGYLIPTFLLGSAIGLSLYMYSFCKMNTTISVADSHPLRAEKAVVTYV